MTTRTVADACELSPVQQGMLFHTQLDPAAGLYLVQLWTPLSGPLHADAFRDAWAWAVERHGVLRTSFLSEGMSRPLQVVHHAVALPWTELDWRGLSADEVDARKEALLAEDRARGFHLAAAPLFRLTLVRLAEDEHLLLWTLHHLILDGWSHTQVLREALARYAALRGGAPFDPPAPRPYRDFVAWLRGRDAGAAEAFWRGALEGVREPTPLGIDAPGHPGADTGFSNVRRTLPPELSRALRERARAHRVTLNTLFQGAWALTLSRYAGEDDVVFGATASGRPASLAGVEEMVGPFINTLPVRVRVPDDAQAGPWLAELQARQAAAREHEHSALVDVQGWTEVPRGRPLFESILAFENFPRVEGAGAGTGGLTVGGLSGVSRTGYPLTLVVHPGDEVLLKAYADRARISDAATERLLGHLETVLRALAEAPSEMRLGEIDLVTAKERAELLAWGSNPTPADPVVVSIPQRIAEQARRAPDAPAAEFRDGTLTYAELDARASRIARRLAALGVRPGDVVGLAAGPSAQMVAALVGILRAGAATVALDPEYPEERLAFMVADTAARVLVTRGGVPAALANADVPVLDLDADAAAIDAEDAADPSLSIPPDAAAYVIYTSGSTGRPKGVVLSHRALVRTVVGSDHAAFGPGTRMAQQSNLSFDAAAWELCGALLTGGTLVGIGREVLLSADYGRELRERRINTGILTTQLFNRHVRETPDVLATLDVLCTGGEQVDAEAMRACLAGGPPRRLLHIYGPTECSVYATWHEVTEVPPGARTVPIGGPMAHTRLYVLDGRGRPVPALVGGELYLGGDRTATMYLGRPALTAERFVPDPFAGTPGARMYRTGDRVRWTEVRECESARVREWEPADAREPHGNGVRADASTFALSHSRTFALEFLARLDGQVKIRGFRIETGEVEAVLRSHPSVTHAAVIAREDVPGDRRLVAYVVGVDGSVPGAAELRAHLARRLPEYMVPAAFVAMDALPITRNGKVDRRALPAPEPAAAADSVAPRDETEALLAELWGEVLGIAGVGVHDGFFAAGGHSLHAMQLAVRVREALRV
ncbi:MAG TPA: amino acid adenylation domain-containing protein, partial [Longimicrobium sp.]|nr:amino acid adenylation domain-containing protein [Longimicrobium sp.]